MEDVKGDILAFLLGFISQNDPEEAYIHILCVHPSSRRQGLARVLVQKFSDIVSSRGCKRVYLITSPHNKKSKSFYLSMGFEAFKGNKTIQIEDIDAVEDYNGPGDHKVLFVRNI
jgi:ribosomal protein S18 acetylase RimI-like enzyme